MPGAGGPTLVLVIKGGPITPGLIRRVKARIDTLFLNFFPDNPLWMIPFECIEAYDALLHQGALRAARARAGRPAQPALPADVLRARACTIRSTPDAGGGARASGARSASSAARYPTASASCASWPAIPLRLWGGGLGPRRRRPRCAPMVAGGPVWGEAKLAVYCGLDAVAEPPPPDERHRGREHPRPSSSRRARRARWWTPRTSSPTLFTPGRGGRSSTATSAELRRAARLLPRPPRRGARHRRERAQARPRRAHPAPPHRGRCCAVVRERFGRDHCRSPPRCAASSAAREHPLDYRARVHDAAAASSSSRYDSERARAATGPGVFTGSRPLALRAGAAHRRSRPPRDASARAAARSSTARALGRRLGVRRLQVEVRGRQSRPAP